MVIQTKNVLVILFTHILIVSSKFVIKLLIEYKYTFNTRKTMIVILLSDKLQYCIFYDRFSLKYFIFGFVFSIKIILIVKTAKL